MDSTPAANVTPGRILRYFSFSARDVLIIAIVIFLAAIAGTLSRPAGLLAAFWPANAVLAGILVRVPRFRTVPVVIAAAAGYVVAALIIGDSLADAMLLTAGNLTGALIFALLFGGLEPEDRSLSRLQGVISLLLMVCGASAIAGAVGGVVLAQIAGLPYFEAWAGWVAAELVNYLALLPVILTVQLPRRWSTRRIRPAELRPLLWPVLALAVAVGLALAVPHPMAMVFPLPALIWCALALPIAATAVLVMLYSGVVMVAIRLGLFDLSLDDGLGGESIAVVHLGLAVLALGPLVIASVNAERRRRIEQLERLTRHDSLTDALARSAFMEQGEDLLTQLRQEPAAAAVLVLDADHFKAINDMHGHPSGDRVLVGVAAAIRTAIRAGDLFGRIGGEEFALVLPRVTRREAEAVAERMRKAVANLAVVLESGDVQRITVSIGVAFGAAGGPGLSEMVSLADRAMYEAKRAGRNQVVVFDFEAPERRPIH